MTPDDLRGRLEMQGFACTVDPATLATARWLRFTPLLSMVVLVAAAILHSSFLLWAFAIIAALGAAGWHLFDILFNAVVARALDAPRLAPNPVPRRFAMAIAAVWSAVAAGLIGAGYPRAGSGAALGLAAAAAIVGLTHFCIGSWMYWRMRSLWRAAT